MLFNKTMRNSLKLLETSREVNVIYPLLYFLLIWLGKLVEFPRNHVPVAVNLLAEYVHLILGLVASWWGD